MVCFRDFVLVPLWPFRIELLLSLQLRFDFIDIVNLQQAFNYLMILIITILLKDMAFSFSTSLFVFPNQQCDEL